MIEDFWLATKASGQAVAFAEMVPWPKAPPTPCVSAHESSQWFWDIPVPTPAPNCGELLWTSSHPRISRAASALRRRNSLKVLAQLCALGLLSAGTWGYAHQEEGVRLHLLRECHQVARCHWDVLEKHRKRHEKTNWEIGKERNRLALQVSPSYYPKIGGMLSKKVKREAFHRWPILERGLHAHFMEW